MIYALVTYDIANDRRRAALSAILSDLGPRVQLSVFEIELPSTQARAELDRRIAATINPDEDQVRIYLIPSMSVRRSIIGNRTLEERHPFYVL